jgi:predicted secreted protein
MKFQSILAIYILFWTMALFVVLPLGVRTPEEEGVDCPPGHAPSAPHRFSFAKAAWRATIVSAIVFGLFYANYVFGWITIGMLDWAPEPKG